MDNGSGINGIRSSCCAPGAGVGAGGPGFAQHSAVGGVPAGPVHIHGQPQQPQPPNLPPPLPPRPDGNGMQMSPYGVGGMSGYSMNGGMYGSAYGSPWSSGYGTAGYGIGGGMYGGNPYGSYGGGMVGYGPGGDSQVSRLAEEQTRTAFQSVENVVRTFSSLSFLLDSSFNAIFTSFRAVLGLADQFSQLKVKFLS